METLGVSDGLAQFDFNQGGPLDPLIPFLLVPAEPVGLT